MNYQLSIINYFVPLQQNLRKKQRIMAKELKDLTKRADNYSQWYNDLVVKADLAE